MLIFKVVMHLASELSLFTGMLLKHRKQIFQILRNIFKHPNWKEAQKLAIKPRRCLGREKLLSKI